MLELVKMVGNNIFNHIESCFEETCNKELSQTRKQVAKLNPV